MLLVVTLALVVASAVLLILGFVQDALGFIYLSMMCAGVAALALFVFARLARRRGAALAGAGVAGGVPRGYMGGGGAEESAPAEQARPRRTGTAKAKKASEPTWEAWDGEDDEAFQPAEREEIDADQGRPVVVPAPASAAGDDSGSDPWADERAEDWGDEVVFPIEDYDDLRVAEILPLLSQLDPDELQEVRDRELAGKARATILDRIDDRLGREAVGSDPAVTTASIPIVEPAATGEPAAPLSPAFSDEASAPAKRPAARKAAGARATKSAAGAKKAPAKKAATAKKATATVPAAAKPPAKRTAVRKAAPASEAADSAVAPEPEGADSAVAPEPSPGAGMTGSAGVPEAALTQESRPAPEPAPESPAETAKKAAGRAKKAPGAAGARKAAGSRKAAGPAKPAAEEPEQPE